ncbi:MAG: efflux RND transporter periplasmic adaptor subunit [Algoriphagus sp.]|uniref:efflux RND transporter periplasmic adaptor subunit n=1 Tax=Algoriphagus sp. TaxID=1872435 RepID=UPI0027370309|nr:efflux RND transporter periplasmic adaptor subunit [Algoriphagus sp.]MDP3200398.1 efflux RND transporter periplasmic adaptor subunit [Algoriphagus sp.]
MAVFFSSCSSSEEEKNNAGNEKYCLDENFKSKIEWVLPEIKSVTEGIHLTGSVETNPDKVIHFVSLVGGIISNTYFSLGDKVTKGQVLAELRSTELSELQSQSKTIDAQIKVGEKKLQSVQSMYNDGISSQKELTEAQSELDILKAEKERINANLNLFSASPEKGIFQIKAPATGIITSKSIAAGTQISAGSEALFTVSDLSEVWVMVNIYANNVQHIETGMEVNIKTLSYPDKIFTGKVAAISQVLDAEAKVLKARVILQNTDFKLKPGMLVDVTALKQGNTEALSIPESVIVFDNNQNYVVVYKGDCDIEIRQIEILTKNSESSFLSGGVNENEKIISKNQLLIYEQIKNFQN